MGNVAQVVLTERPAEQTHASPTRTKDGVPERCTAPEVKVPEKNPTSHWRRFAKRAERRVGFAVRDSCITPRAPTPTPRPRLRARRAVGRRVLL